MTPPSETDDSLTALTPPRPVHFAEQALLGALVLEPALATQVDLEAQHFDNRTHGILFAAMCTVPAPDLEQHRESADWVAAVYATARPQAPGLPHTYLHTLVQACPRHEHAGAYAWMIRADHARRTVRIHAERLALIATDTTLPHRMTATIAQADRLADLLDSLSGRFTPHPGSLPRTPLPPDPVSKAEEEAVDDEKLLLATATASPQDVQTMRWLTPGDFTVPFHGSLWQCVTGLVHRGDAVDPVTVLWEAQQAGLLTGTATAGGLLDLLSDPFGEPGHWGARIMARSLLHRARTTATRILAVADDPATTPYQLLTGSRRALADLNAVRARWQHATAPAPQAPATPARRAPPAVGASPAPAGGRPLRGSISR
ncbi:replicative DNA helicase [Streptomyces sp. CB04723]|uniref:DnaB-like helicase N-terminal domain-containing protein n=1 Tax=Streptomyces TaxID=1883 RepID=UPI0015C486A2|nr:DnaB-like helicase N-terminal domain-containing protein [Streptomyces sp. CB04723]QLG31339.1 replicative DNA helicase [Streptomyces sp. CB04723]